MSLSVAAQASDAQTIYKHCSKAVFAISVKMKDGSTKLGSGFFLRSNGVGVTCLHVLKGGVSAVATLSSGVSLEVDGVIDIDSTRDLALVKLHGVDLPVLSPASARPPVGSRAFVIGSPLGLDFSISDGLLSQVRTIGNVVNYQFSCPASHGNSGGPLLNGRGEVEGVVDWQFVEGQNLNFAVPVQYVNELKLNASPRPLSSLSLAQVDQTALLIKLAEGEDNITIKPFGSERFDIDSQTAITAKAIQVSSDQNPSLKASGLELRIQVQGSVSESLYVDQSEISDFKAALDKSIQLVSKWPDESHKWHWSPSPATVLLVDTSTARDVFLTGAKVKGILLNTDVAAKLVAVLNSLDRGFRHAAMTPEQLARETTKEAQAELEARQARIQTELIAKQAKARAELAAKQAELAAKQAELAAKQAKLDQWKPHEADALLDGVIPNGVVNDGLLIGLTSPDSRFETDGVLVGFKMSDADDLIALRSWEQLKELTRDLLGKAIRIKWRSKKGSELEFGIDVKFVAQK